MAKPKSPKKTDKHDDAETKDVTAPVEAEAIELPEPDETDETRDESTEAGRTDAADTPMEETAANPLEDATDAGTPVESEEKEEATVVQQTPVVVSPPAVVERGAPFWPLVLGGVVAAFLGFVAARTEFFDPALPPSWRSMGADTETAERVSALDQTVAALRSELDELRNAEPQAAPDTSEPIAALTQAVNALTARIEEVEARPIASASTVPVPVVDLAPVNEQLAEQQAQIAQLMEEARQSAQSASNEAARALARAAANRVLAAVDSGTPFETALTDLQDTTDLEIPPALNGVAADGVATLADLQQSLPEAARAALAAARAGTDDPVGFGGFLKRQLGARSVQPREGDDPDAILSRVEDATRNGRLTEALAEANTLPDAALAEMQPWLDRAQARVDAINAATTLTSRLAAN